MDDFLWFIIVTLLVPAILLSVVFGTCAGVYSLTGPPSCYNIGKSLGLKTEWGFWQGCIYTLKNGTKLTESQFNKYYRVNQDQ